MLGNTIKTMGLCALLFLLAACSNKTKSTAASPAPQEQRSANDRPPRQGQGQRGERPDFAELLTKMDSNQDGKLSKTEVKGRLQQNFAQIDSNQDGYLSAEEFAQAPPPPRR